MDFLSPEIFNTLFLKISDKSLWIFFVVFVLVVLIVSLILFYHWKKYGIHSPMVGKTKLIYFIGIVALLAFSAIALAVHTL